MFWFWNRSEEYINRMWELAWGLGSVDIAVEMIKCDHPGQIIYADDHQVAAVPHRGASSRVRRLLR